MLINKYYQLTQSEIAAIMDFSMNCSDFMAINQHAVRQCFQRKCLNLYSNALTPVSH